MLHGAGIFTYIYLKNHPNVGKYSIHGASGSGTWGQPFVVPRGESAQHLFVQCFNCHVFWILWQTRAANNYYFCESRCLSFDPHKLFKLGFETDPPKIALLRMIPTMAFQSIPCSITTPQTSAKQPYICDILWHSFWHMYLAYLLTFFLAFYLVYLRRFFVVEVRRGILWS